MCELLILKFIPIYATLTIGSIYGFYSVFAYMKNDYNYSIALQFIWFIFITFWGWGASTMQAISYGLIYLTSYYLKLRFEQIADRMQKVKRQNIGSLLTIMEEHKIVTKMTDQYNSFFSILMAVNYFAATIVVNLFIYIGFYGKGNIYFRSLVSSQIVYSFFVIYLATYTSANISKQVYLLIVKIF